jgi:DNA-binding winged helix-turn-helix (wHTH) protein/class 3 adenylate cyclase
MIYTFGDYELDTTLYELRAAGAPCPLEPRVFNILAYLVQHHAHVVTREELLDHLWPGLHISDTLLNTYIMEARKAVGDSGQVQRVIKTLHGRGYRFIAPTTAQRAQHPPWAPPRPPAVPRPTVPLGHARLARVSPATGAADEAFQDILAGDQTVGTVVCGALDQGDMRMVGVEYESVQRLRQTFFALAQAEAQRAAGTCTFFGADGIVLRCTQEGHAPRAVQAALALHQRLQDAVTALEAPRPLEATVRCGVHTGPLAVPRLTEVPWDASVTTAETTTVAVWLHYLAVPGTLLTSQATLVFLPATIPWVEQELVRLPGQAEPIMTYCIRSPERQRPARRAPRADRSYMVMKS